ncbi:MAG: hypothetical protein JXR94_12090, partial [Candidatus Hydrogenedentes bacterium]|nr:hypothetical protein [Candidatus Hydrogenedentota bacterium]
MKKAKWLLDGYTKLVRGLVFLLSILAGVGILTMMCVTCLDVVLRMFRAPLTGAVDIVKIAGAVT